VASHKLRIAIMPHRGDGRDEKVQGERLVFFRQDKAIASRYIPVRSSELYAYAAVSPE